MRNKQRVTRSNYRLTDTRPIIDPARLPARYCLEPGCSAPTSCGKHYCTRHVLGQPYAAQIHAEVEATERELAMVAELEGSGRDGSEAVDVDGVIAQDLLHLAGSEPVTVARAGKAVSMLYGMGERVVAAYVRALSGAGLATTRQGKCKKNVWLEVVA